MGAGAAAGSAPREILECLIVQPHLIEGDCLALATLKLAPKIVDVFRSRCYPFAALPTAFAAAITLQQPLIVVAQVNAARSASMAPERSLPCLPSEASVVFTTWAVTCLWSGACGYDQIS